MDAIKSHQKLVSLGEQMGHCNIDNEQMDLCRCLYKLHFQLMLILDSFAKLLRLVAQFCKEVSVEGQTRTLLESFIMKKLKIS